MLRFPGLYVVWLPLRFEREVDEMPRRSILRPVVAANIVGPPSGLHEQHEAVIGDRKSCSLACHWLAYQGCFSNAAFTFSMVAGLSCWRTW